MRDDEFGYTPWGAKLGGQIYWNAVNALRDVWFEIYGEHIEVSVQGKAGFRRLLDEIKRKLVDKRGLEKIVVELRDRGYDLADPTNPDQLFKSLLALSPSGIREIDDITPNEFKAAVYSVADQARESGNDGEDIPLEQFFRRTLDHLWSVKGLSGRINVGENRHFPRMFQWLKEVAGETDWGEGKGLKIMNTSRRGAVGSNPSGPQGLTVRLNFNYI